MMSILTIMIGVLLFGFASLLIYSILYCLCGGFGDFAKMDLETTCKQESRRLVFEGIITLVEFNPRNRSDQLSVSSLHNFAEYCSNIDHLIERINILCDRKIPFNGIDLRQPAEQESIKSIYNRTQNDYEAASEFCQNCYRKKLALKP